MNAIFLLRYRRNTNGTQQMSPVYAESVTAAWGIFYLRLSQQLGADVDGCRLLSHREIPEHLLNLRNEWHQDILNQLSPEDRLSFFQDRRERQTKFTGTPSLATERNLSNLEMELTR